jgi:hypothetical protein
VEGGRERAPSAVCRKIATAVLTGEHHLDIWGDGEQTRSFMYSGSPRPSPYAWVYDQVKRDLG